MCGPCKIILNEAAAAASEGISIQRGVSEAVLMILDKPKKYDPEKRFSVEVQNRMSALDAAYLDHYHASRSDAAAPAFPYWAKLKPILRDMAGVESFSALLEE